MPKGLRKIQIIVGEKHLTRFGAIFLIHWFCKKLMLKCLLPNCNLQMPRGEHRINRALLIFYADENFLHFCKLQKYSYDTPTTKVQKQGSLRFI